MDGLATFNVDHRVENRITAQVHFASIQSNQSCRFKNRMRRGDPVFMARRGQAKQRAGGLVIGTHHDAFQTTHRFVDCQLPIKRRMDEATQERAQKYAYHFFFRRMIPLPFMVPNGKGTLYDVSIERLDELLPGEHKGLDVICDGVLKGTPFIYPAEELGVHDL